MVQTFFGLILLVAPLCLIFCYEYKPRAFTKIFLIIVIFQTTIALLTQFLGIFSYPVVIIFNSIFVLVCVFECFRRKKILHKKISLNLKEIWRKIPCVSVFTLFAFAIVFFELFSVHYFYTGIATNINGFVSVHESSYSYPIFSDEWVGIAYSDYSMRTHLLPMANPLYHDAPFNNLMLPYFSLIAEIFVLLALNPLAGYVPLSIGVGLLLCFLIYHYLRAHRVDPFAAGFAVVMVPLIVEGANLPGIWTLLPFMAGLVVFIAGLPTPASKENIFFGASIVSVLLYPPMIVFIIPAVLLSGTIRSRFKIITTVILSIIILTIGAILISPFIPFLKEGMAFIFRDNLVGGIPSFPITTIIPWLALAFSIVGIWGLIHRKRYELVAVISVGLIFWIAYAFTMNVFIIDYPRVVVITSFFLIIASGFGFDIFLKKLRSAKYNGVISFLKVAFVFVFIFIAFSYPLDTWGRLVLNVRESSGDSGGGNIHATSTIVSFSPASPIGRYLTNDDIRLFSGISEKNFIAPPWKGLTIGATMHDYPLQSKASTLTVSEYLYDDFMNLDCAGKSSIAEKYQVSYVYSSHFSCEGFSVEGSSTEGLYLYAFSKN